MCRSCLHVITEKILIIGRVPTPAAFVLYPICYSLMDGSELEIHVEAENQEDKVEGILIDYIENARSLRNITSISAEEFARWTGQIMDAIDYLHQKGLIWDDAKAANILIGEDGNTMLIDFDGDYINHWIHAENHDITHGDLQDLE